MVPSSAVGAAPDGTLYFTDWPFAQVRKITPDGRVSAFAGSGFTPFSGDGQVATSAGIGGSLNVLALDRAGNLYLDSFGAYALRKVTTDGRIKTIVGNGQRNGGLADVYGLASDGAGAVYYSDTTAIRKYAGGSTGTLLPNMGQVPLAVSPAGVLHYVSGQEVYTLENGVSTRIAGTPNPKPGLINDGLPATDAFLPFPNAIAFDHSGNLYISGTVTFGGPGAVWRVGSDGIQRRIAGPGADPVPSPDGTPAASATFPKPSGISVDDSGNIYLAAGFSISVLVPDTGSGCAVHPSSNTIVVSSGGGDSPVTVTASAYICPWQVRTDSSWITPSIAGGSGSGAVVLGVAANTGDARQATVFIADSPWWCNSRPGRR